MLGFCSIKVGGMADTFCLCFNRSSALLRCMLPDSEFMLHLLLSEFFLV